MEYNESQRQLWSSISHRNSTSIRRKKYHNQCLGREFALDVFAHLVHWFVEAFCLFWAVIKAIAYSGTQELGNLILSGGATSVTTNRVDMLNPMERPIGSMSPEAYIKFAGLTVGLSLLVLLLWITFTFCCFNTKRTENYDLQMENLWAWGNYVNSFSQLVVQ